MRDLDATRRYASRLLRGFSLLGLRDDEPRGRRPVRALVGAGMEKKLQKQRTYSARPLDARTSEAYLVTMSDESKAKAYQAALDADAAFQVELERVYGKAAGDARYRATHDDPRVRAAKAAKLAADATLQETVREGRASDPGPCGSGWTGDRCSKRLGHRGRHSNE